MKKHKTQYSPTARAFFLWVVVVLPAFILIHGVDASAEVRCRQLQDQAAEFDQFYMSETEKEMCKSVGVTVDVRFPPEMLEDKDRTDKEKHDVVEIDTTWKVPEWYRIQQLGQKADRAYEFLRDDKLRRICACESAGRPDAIPQQYESDGVTTITGRVTPGDKGMCQISTKHWGAAAAQLGLNILEPFGNVAMANYIYDHYGAKPWYLSKACHGVQ